MKHLAPWRKPLYALLALLLAADLTYSFLQYLHQPLDGDMAWNVVPAADVAPVLHDPLGFEAIVHGRTYPNPNRFFCHWVLRAYLGDAPLLLQSRFHAIDSVYLACAIAKVVIHLLLLFLLAAYATGSIDVRRLDFIGAAVLITPLFQANGYRSYMGIIDPSTTYSFFYALPCALLLVYFLPVFLRAGADRGLRRHWWWTVPFAFVVCLSGPLNPGAVLVAVLLLIAQPLLSALRNGWAGPVPFLRSLPASYGPYLLPVVVSLGLLGARVGTDHGSCKRLKAPRTLSGTGCHGRSDQRGEEEEPHASRVAVDTKGSRHPEEQHPSIVGADEQPFLPAKHRSTVMLVLVLGE